MLLSGTALVCAVLGVLSLVMAGSGRIYSYPLVRLAALLRPESAAAGAGYTILQQRELLGMGQYSLWGRTDLPSWTVARGIERSLADTYVLSAIFSRFGIIGQSHTPCQSPKSLLPVAVDQRSQQDGICAVHIIQRISHVVEGAFDHNTHQHSHIQAIPEIGMPSDKTVVQIHDSQHERQPQVRQMGDPVETGAQLNRIHRPGIPLGLIALALALTAAGILTQICVFYEISDPPSWGYVLQHYVGRTLVYNLLGLALMLGIMYLDYSFIGRHAYRRTAPLYAL